jgi:hypothetical protein
MAQRIHTRPLVGLVALVFTVLGCGAPAPTSSSPQSSAPSAAPTHRVGIRLAGPPMACYGLGELECQRVTESAGTVVNIMDPRVIYVQVGPFGCAYGQQCPSTLAARPEGDVTIEIAGAPAVGIHVRAAPAGGAIAVAPQEIFGTVLEPMSATAAVFGAQPFTLGHCGLWSGIDLGGSWWDPVGLIDFNQGDAINAAEGTIAFNDPDHATFTSKGGLTVQLQRRDGGKHLPTCD